MRFSLIYVGFSTICYFALCVESPANPHTMLPLHGDGNLVMASEDLTVRLSTDTAKLTGTFRFKRRHDVDYPGRRFPVRLQIPVWFPERDDQNPLVAEFWTTFPQHESEGRLSPTNRAVFNRALDLHVWVGEQLLEITNFFVLTNLEEYGIQEPGWCCLVFLALFDADTTLVSQRLRVSYCQPLLHQGQEARFVYVPVLYHLPVITDTESYHIMVIPEEVSPVEISNGDRRVVVENGWCARLTPQHHVPIRAVVKAPANERSRMDAGTNSVNGKYVCH